MRRSSSSVTVSDNGRRGSPYESYSEDIKGGVLLVSVDFDSCLAGTAFVQRYKQIAHLRETNFQQYVKEYKKILADVHPQLINNILAHAENADEVIVMIGSNRQLPDIDKSNARNNGNGSCFDGVPILADLLQDLMPKKKVSHQPYTIGDSVFNQPDGYTGNVTLAQAEPEAGWDKSGELARVFADVIKDKKYFLMYQQAMMICAARPNAKVDMVFYDDLPEVLTVAAHQFAAKGVANAMPANFGSIALNSYEDNKLLAVPNCILEYIQHGESGEIPGYLLKDCLTLIKVLREATDRWIALANTHSEQIAKLRERTAELNQLKSAAQLESNKKTDALVMKYLFANTDFADTFDKTIQVINKSIVAGTNGAELAAQFQKAMRDRDNATLVALLMNPPFQGLIQGADATSQLSVFMKMYRELAKQIRSENSGIIAGYKTELERIDREYQINNNLLKSFSLCESKHLQALAAAEAYFNSHSTFALDEVRQHVDAIKQATNFLDAKAITNMTVLRDETGDMNDNTAIDVKSVCGAMLDIVRDTDHALLRQDNNRLHPVKMVEVNGTFPVQHCSAIFRDHRSHNRFVAACMSDSLWNTEMPAPDIGTMESVFYQMLALENLRQLLTQSPFKEKIESEKRSEGVKNICRILVDNPDKLEPLALLEAIKQIAMLEAAKGVRRTFRINRKSSDPDNIALYKMLAKANMESPVMLISMNSIHSYLMSNGSKYQFVKPSSAHPQVARSSRNGVFRREHKRRDSDTESSIPQLKRDSSSDE